MNDRADAERRKILEAQSLAPEQLNHLLNRIEEPLDEARSRRRARMAFTFAVLLTGVLGLLSWRTARQATEDAAWVAHTHEVFTTLEVTLRHLLDVETGGRGFALTGNPAFLDPFEGGRSGTTQDLRALGHLVADNPGQKSRLAVLEEKARDQIAASEALVGARRSSGAVPQSPQMERGKFLMDAARASVEGMEAEERRLLDERIRRGRTAQRFAASAIILGSLLGIVFLSIAGAVVVREIGVSARARAQVNFLNAELERRVAARTAALGESEGRLAGVIQSAMDSIITVNEEHRIVLFNGAAEKTFLCPAAEALAQPIDRFIPQKFHAVDARHIRGFAETGITNRAKGQRTLLQAVRADGQEFEIEASISQVVAAGKKLFTVILRDVTERTQAEVAL